MSKKKSGGVLDMSMFTSAEDAIAARRSRTLVPVSPNLDYRLNGGILEGSLVLVQTWPKVGKMQPMDSVVYTPNGPILMGDIKIGQEICTETGGSCKVVNTFDHIDKDVYKMHFNDGSSVECGLEHLWQVIHRCDFTQSTKVLSTEEIINAGLNDQLGYTFHIELTKPVFFNEQTTDEDPYEFGKRITQEGAEFIYEPHLYNSIDHREKVLFGILGVPHVSLAYRSNIPFEFNGSSNCEKLLNFLQLLAQSLGIFVEKIENKINIHFGRCNYKSITKIELSRKSDCRCIEVDNPTRLYLTDHFTVTHNTMLAMLIAENALKQGRYVVYADVECRLDEFKYGVDKLQEKYPNKFLLLKSNKEVGVLSGNQVYEQIYKMTMIPKYYGTVYIIDSISHATPKASLEDSEIKADRRDQNAKLNSDFCKKVGNYLRVSDSIVIGIQHLTTVQHQNYVSVEADGGNKLQFEADIVLKCTEKPKDLDGIPLHKGESENALGQLINWDIPFNKLGKPYISKENPCKNFLLFGNGCWWSREALEVLIEIGLVAVGGGGWHSFMTEKVDGKYQGAEKATAVIEENKEYFESILQQYFKENFHANYDFRNQDN